MARYPLSRFHDNDPEGRVSPSLTAGFRLRFSALPRRVSLPLSPKGGGHHSLPPNRRFKNPRNVASPFSGEPRRALCSLKCRPVLAREDRFPRRVSLSRCGASRFRGALPRLPWPRGCSALRDRRLSPRSTPEGARIFSAVWPIAVRLPPYRLFVAGLSPVRPEGRRVRRFAGLWGPIDSPRRAIFRILRLSIASRCPRLSRSAPQRGRGTGPRMHLAP